MYTVYVQVTRLRTGRNGIPTPAGERRPTLLKNAHTGSEANPIQWVSEILCPGIKRLGHKDNQSRPIHAEEWTELHLHFPNMSSRREQGLYLLRPSIKA